MNPVRSRLPSRRRFWQDYELWLLAQIYPHCPTVSVAKALERNVHAVYRMAAKLALAKTPEFLDSPFSGRLRKGETRPGSERTQFRKGQVPANKGLRRPGWYSGRMRESQFKRGQRTGVAARNWKPIGTILPDSEGFLRIKVREAVYGAEATGFGNTKVWPLLGRVVWAQHHGPIPPGHIVAFKDRDRSNCTIENLELLTLQQNMERNSFWKVLPRELAEVIHLSGALKRQIRRLSNNGKEQDHRPSGSSI